MTIVLAHGTRKVTRSGTRWLLLSDATMWPGCSRRDSMHRCPKPFRQPTFTATGSRTSWRTSTNRSTSSVTSGAAATW